MRARTAMSILTLLATTAPLAADGIVHVDDDAPPGGDGTSWKTAFRFLADGLSATEGAVEVRVAQGVYLPDRSDDAPGGTGDRTATFLLPDGIPVVGGYAGLGAADPDEQDPAHFVTIASGDLAGDDGPGFAHRGDNALTVISAFDTTVELRGVTVRGGNADDEPGEISPTWLGGGIYVFQSQATLRDCRIEDNIAYSGAGVYAREGDGLDVTACAFEGNQHTSVNAGGAMRARENGALSVSGSTFRHNLSPEGTGIGIGVHDCDPVTVTDCGFIENVGGISALTIKASGDTVVERCEFRNNRTSASCAFVMDSLRSLTMRDLVVREGRAGASVGGGAVSDIQEGVVLERCIFHDNTAPSYGGTLLMVADSIVVTECQFTRNASLTSAGISLGDRVESVRIVGTTFAANDGTAVDVGDDAPPGAVEVHNSIVWGNTDVPFRYVGAVEYSAVEGGWPGTGNIDADPMLVDAVNGNARLRYGSPCLDAGNNDATPPWVTVDLDGDVRRQDDPDAPDTGHGSAPIVDMGPFEGGHEADGSTATTFGLDSGDLVILIPDGGPFDPAHSAAVIVECLDGSDGMFAATLRSGVAHPGSGGYDQDGATIEIVTDMAPGAFTARVFLPSAEASSDPTALEFARYHAAADGWTAGVAANVTTSPDRHGPIGDAFVERSDDPPVVFSDDVGDYGVYEHVPSGTGFVWGNVDVPGLYGLGLPRCPSDIAPFGGDSRVDVHDLLAVLAGWGFAGASTVCDLDRNDVVDSSDLGLVLGAWGECGQPRRPLAPWSPIDKMLRGVAAERDTAALLEAITSWGDGPS